MTTLIEQFDRALEDERLTSPWVSAAVRVAITSVPMAWDSRDGTATVAIQPRALISETYGGTRGEHKGHGVFSVGFKPGEQDRVRRVLEQLDKAGARGEVTLSGVTRTVAQPFEQPRSWREPAPRVVIGRTADNQPVYAA